jgi:hypothetical protein
MRNLRSAVATAILCGIGLLAASNVRADDVTPAAGAEVEAINKLKQAGAQISEVAQNDHHIEVAFHLSSNKITDEQIAPLKDLARLVVMVNLRGTEITDAGLEQLKGLENLEYLNLYSTPITDAGLKHLEGLKKLRHVYVWQTQVTDAGVNALKAAVPEVKIIRGQ